MTDRGKIKSGIEKRLIALRVLPSPEGDGIGILDTVIDGVEDEVCLICAIDTIPDSLNSAIADIAAADFAELILGEESGAVSKRADGELSASYVSGTSATERKLAACGRMRRRGLDAVKKYRRIKW